MAMGFFLPLLSITYYASGSVCPKGWTLPSKDEYVNLITTVYGLTSGSANSIKLRSDPLSFNYNGRLNYNGLLDSENTIGYYWFGTVYISDAAYVLNFNSSAINPQSYNLRGVGLAVRCVGGEASGRLKLCFCVGGEA